MPGGTRAITSDGATVGGVSGSVVGGGVTVVMGGSCEGVGVATGEVVELVTGEENNCDSTSVVTTSSTELDTSVAMVIEGVVCDG